MSFPLFSLVIPDDLNTAISFLGFVLGSIGFFGYGIRPFVEWLFPTKLPISPKNRNSFGMSLICVNFALISLTTGLYGLAIFVSCILTLAIFIRKKGLMELMCCFSNPVLFYYRPSFFQSCNNIQTI